MMLSAPIGPFLVFQYLFRARSRHLGGSSRLQAQQAPANHVQIRKGTGDEQHGDVCDGAT